MEDEEQGLQCNTRSDIDLELLSPGYLPSPLVMNKNVNSYNEEFANSFKVAGRETLS